MNHRASRLRGLLFIEHHRQLFIINLDEISGVFSGVTVFGDHHRDRMSDKQNFISGEHTIVGRLQIRQGGGARYRANFCRNIFAGINGHHAGNFCGSAGIHALDARMGIDGTQKNCVQGVRQLDVVNVMSQSLNQARVFGTLYSLAKIFFRHEGLRRLAGNSRFGFHLLGSELDGLHNMLVAGAAAEVSFQPVPDFCVAGIRISFQDLCCGHDHARRAVAALQAMMFPETFLHRMQLAFCSQSFNGGYFRAVSLDCEQRAGLYRLSIYKHSAGTTQ